jgi:hypothetical protein
MQLSEERRGGLAVTAITLRNIPPKLQEAIQRRAGKDGLSLNKAVIRMLEEAAGQGTTGRRELHYDFDHLAGTWSEKEAAAFDEALAEQRRVDPELWR